MNKGTIAILVMILATTALVAQSKRDAVANGRAIELGRSYFVTSTELSERRQLNVYLPPDYNDSARYPVIYLLDGGMDEDFIHIVGLVQFNTFPWVHRMPESIVVGIVNVDRKRDFTFPTNIKSDKQAYLTTGGAQKFIAFLDHELKPFVQTHFRANGKAMLVGESLGGLLAATILCQHPSLFDQYVIVSPSLWWNDGSLLNGADSLSSAYPLHNTLVYIAVGKEGLTPGPHPHVMEVDAHLLAEKIDSAHNAHLKVYLDYMPDEDHATIMHQAVSNAFKKLNEM